MAGRARKKRWETFKSKSNSANIVADPAQSANDLVGSWNEKPLGLDVVVPITVARDRLDWYEGGLEEDLVAGLRTGELAGVIFKVAPGLASLLFVGGVLKFAI